MKFEIPAALRAEHEELHAQLLKATAEPGAVGEAAREVARLLHPHFVREEEFALPPLALLAELACGAVRPEMAAVLPMTRKLKAELPAMLAEHRQIVLALDRLRTAAKTAGRPEYERFARALVQHAETEERVLYPAVILLGEHLERTLRKEPVTLNVD
jgi:hypothetical protein